MKPPEQNTKAVSRWIAVVFTVICCWMFLEGRTAREQNALLEEEGSIVNATVVGGDFQRVEGKGGPTFRYFLDVEFSTLEGLSTRKRTEVDVRTFHVHVDDGRVIRPAVEVRYQRSNADNCRVVGDPPKKQGLMAGSIVLFAYMMFVLWLSRENSSNPKQA